MDSVNKVENSAAEVEEKTPAKPTPPASKVAAKPAARPAASAATGEKTIESQPPGSEVNKMRRRITWACIGGFLVASFLMFLRFFLPRTIFEPSNTFRIGFPQDFAFGVDTKFQQMYRIWVVRNAERLFVIYARCTHLGCTPDWKESEQKFKCPCHGSGYDSDGVNFEGPAPRPMDRAHLEIGPDGQIVVNVDKLYQQPKGLPTQFNDEGAFLRV
jgi:cytochrome b6-f complex iron-sulfur subunit